MSDQIIEMLDVNKWFGDFQVLKNINLKVSQKQKIVVCGPSGSGKSTLIRCINRLEEHQKGKIIVDGIELSENTKNIEKIRAEVGMVFQQFNLFPHLSILDNCTLAPIWEKNAFNRFDSVPTNVKAPPPDEAYILYSSKEPIGSSTGIQVISTSPVTSTEAHLSSGSSVAGKLST